jgi:CubicO group peptidase (beta-lactamase class C family)
LTLSHWKLAFASVSAAALVGAPSPSMANHERPIGPVINQIQSFVEKSMAKTGVPGVAVGIVCRDKIVYLKGFGVRKAGCRAPVNADTIFQLASLSKPIASTVIAGLVGAHEISWDDRIIKLDPEFRLSNPNVTEQITIRDFLSHRSGLPTSSGDALEDLGFSRSEVLHQMRLLHLTGQFRKTYKYSNFGYTEGAIAAAKGMHKSWEDLAEERLFEQLGMKSTSYRYSDYKDAGNKAAIHVFANGKAVARYQRDPDAEAPAGAASSSVRDLAEWLRLQLSSGGWNGKQIVASDALKQTHSPQIAIGRDPNTGGTSYYGLGWDVNYDRDGKLMLSHSGAFFIGVSTAVRLSPSDQLGIVVLTNALPTGLAEAITSTFFDLYKYGAPRRDWLTLFGGIFRTMLENSNNESKDYSRVTPPSNPVPSGPLSAYVGTYRNDYYGDIEISKVGDSLWMRLPAAGALYTLRHWYGKAFTYRFEAEQGIGTRGVVFNLSGTPHVLIENLAVEGNGVFTRIER